MSKPRSGYKTIVSINGTPVQFLTDVDGPGYKKEFIDITTMDSQDRWAEYASDFKDGDEVQLTGRYVPEAAALAVVNAAFASDDEQTISIQHPAPTPSGALPPPLTMKGFVSMVKPKSQHRGSAMEFTMSIKLTGKPTSMPGIL